MNPPLPHWTVQQLVSTLERSGLHGHGGAYFPTATKLSAVASQRKSASVVVNATEGEPLSSKDRFLLTTQLDTVLDGALMVAQALEARSVTVAVEDRRTQLVERVRAAIARRPELNRRGLVSETVGVPPGYVSGQETALVQALSGGPAKPTLAPPYPFEKGVNGRPTFVSNTETFAQIGLIARQDYRHQRLVTVSGCVGKRSVLTITGQTTVADVLAAAGGVTEDVRAVLLGGYGGTWVAAPDAFGLALDEPELRSRRLTLGAGIVFALGMSACPVAEVAHVARWMSGQSAGQCGPCVFGLDAIASELESLTQPLAGDADLGRLRRWSGMVTRRGACAHPDGVARFITSALTVFGPEFEDHARHGGCDICARPRVMPTPGGASGSHPAARLALTNVGAAA